MLKPPNDKISAETREKLLALADYVEADRRHALRMESFYSPYRGTFDLPEPPPTEYCGTSACLAGYLAIIRGDAEELYANDLAGFVDRGMDDLGISHDQARKLFLDYPPAITSRAKAVRVLRNFAYTGEVDWGV